MTSFFLLATLSLSLVCICQADLISDVCSKTINPSLCTQTLKSNPSAPKADLRGLGQIIIPIAKAATQNVITISKSIGGPIADTCIETSTDAIDNLDECVGYLKKSDKASISDLQTKASAASTDVGTCDDEFGDSEPAKLKAASQKAQDLISVLLAIANKL
ncbi:pectinesterase inhibitor [Phtheirospermum japonicum]|uniref:Pectinesterase inhibitor n=1 Tax=Phtheirospermum japonicum TaxID=374723 RepID=A0A830CJ66_9LAMI|nr:pectinesterase inhibitor [Phtheirospermum japonicum]